MENYHPLKLKRKDLEDVNEDFSDFSRQKNTPSGC
ncbi:hypothetical protein CASFOL_030631 [Castilleja foliolosa]|uniref:Uncharacterized protein n=1 Tax=Castilleja foliolosa TaxID=1961234 RepID=A0ABD3C5U8_9LAMI